MEADDGRTTESSAAGDVRNAMSEFVKKNSISIERLLTTTGGDLDRATSANEDRTPDFGALVGTQKERASVKEKQLLLKARHQRNFARILRSKKNVPENIKEPCGTLDPPQDAVAVAENLNDLKKPAGVYDNVRFFCDCEGCKAHRDTQLKADKWWLAGDRDRAMGYKDKPCLNLLPLSYNSILKRKYRPRLPKKPDHVPALWKTIDGVDFNKTFTEGSTTHQLSRGTTNGGFRRMATIDADDYEAIDRAIEETESQIRRMVGSSDWCAEVVVIVTSLTANRCAYQESYRLLRFFEAKGVDHIAIDVNADIGIDSIDYKLLRKWDAEKLLLRDSNKIADGVTLPVIVPQVLIDGVPVGPLEEILTLEDENDLDYIIAREACPNCLANKKVTSGHCGRCSALFRDLISLKYMTPDEIRLLLLRSAKNACHIKAPTPYDWEKRRRQLGLKGHNEDTRTWFTPDDLKKFGTPSLGFCVDFS